MLLLQIWMDYSRSLGAAAALRHHEQSRSGLKLGPRRSGRRGVGAHDSADYVRPINWKRATPRFFPLLFKAKHIKSGGLISQPLEWRERLSDRRRPAD